MWNFMWNNQIWIFPTNFMIKVTPQTDAVIFSFSSSPNQPLFTRGSSVSWQGSSDLSLYMEALPMVALRSFTNRIRPDISYALHLLPCALDDCDEYIVCTLVPNPKSTQIMKVSGMKISHACDMPTCRGNISPCHLNHDKYFVVVIMYFNCFLMM